MQKLVKENEGFFILKLVASEIHSHFYKVRDICLKFYEQVIGLTRMQKLVII